MVEDVAPGARVDESPRTTAASVLAGLFAADDPANSVDEAAQGPGPFRRRKGASMNKRSSPTKGAAIPFSQPVWLHARLIQPRGGANPSRASPQGPAASCARPPGGLQAWSRPPAPTDVCPPERPAARASQVPVAAPPAFLYGSFNGRRISTTHGSACVLHRATTTEIP